MANDVAFPVNITPRKPKPMKWRAMKRLLRRLSTTGNSNLPIALSEVFLVFVGLLIQIAHRAWVKYPYGANSNGHISPPRIFLPADISKENLTRFALTGLELARPADWRQNMTNHKTRTLILGLFFEARGPPYAFYLISPRPLDLTSKRWERLSSL